MSHEGKVLLGLGVGAGVIAAIAAVLSSDRGQAAIRQASANLNEAGDYMADKLMDWVPTLIGKTAAHEGYYWSVQKNIDKQGVSYGILQWTQRGGGLARVLRAMHAAAPDAFDMAFGGVQRATALLATVSARTPEARMAPVDGAYLWEEPWVSRFRAAGGPVPERNPPRLPAPATPLQVAMFQHAAGSEYMLAAVNIARVLGVTSERAMVLYYNRTVHQGPSVPLRAARELAEWYGEDPSRRPADPNDVVAQFAWKCAAPFRRTAAPATTRFSDLSSWRPVTAEYSELKQHDYRTTKVAVTRPTWHVFTNGWKVSTYDMITKRSSEILTDPTLRDEPVELDQVSTLH